MNNKKHVIVGLAILLLAVAGGGAALCVIGLQNNAVVPNDDIETIVESGPIVETLPPTLRLNLPIEALQSKSAVVYDLGTKQIVFAKNPDQVQAPASLVKLMTALLAIEHLPNLDQQFVVKSTTIAQMKQRQASLAGFYAGEAVSVRDLLYGTILASGGEASITLAEAVTGDQASFIELMNQKAASLGLKQTFFKSSEGLDAEGQVSSAQDMIVLLEYALTNGLFREIFTTRQYQATSLKRTLVIDSTVFGKMTQTMFNQSELIGAKSGTTGQAGLCLASLVRYEQRELLVVTMGAPLVNWPNPLPYHLDDLGQILSNLGLAQ